ncbi:MAG TPA: hypothetical protein VHE81_14600 [Lacipirellulaceae bacterium]|nr:hypothetical protein [Lacipirellulaceae bacterium]
MRAPRTLFAVAMLLGSYTAATAANIGNIYNTGVNNSGVAFASPNVVDPHYSIILPANNTAVTVDDTTYPFPPWLPNNAGSRWIGPAADSFGPAGPWIYRTTFTVPANAILSTVSVTGDWATDDPGTDIRINGASTGQTSPSYLALTPFSINSGFVAGTNTLDFYLTNAGGPTGLRVDHISGTYQVPEPQVVFLATVVISVSALVRRRRSQKYFGQCA